MTSRWGDLPAAFEAHLSETGPIPGSVRTHCGDYDQAFQRRISAIMVVGDVDMSPLALCRRPVSPYRQHLIPELFQDVANEKAARYLLDMRARIAPLREEMLLYEPEGDFVEIYESVYALVQEGQFTERDGGMFLSLLTLVRSENLLALRAEASVAAAGNPAKLRFARTIGVF